MPHPAEQIRFCTSRDGTRIAYTMSGSGPPLAWIGHWTRHLKFDWDNPVWRPWLSLLTRHHSVVRYDWRGCGLSDRDDVEFSFGKYVDDFEAVVDAAGLKSFPVAAMAIGAAVAITYAVRHPERVSKLVLWGSQSSGWLIRGRSLRQTEEGDARLKMIELGWPNESSAYGQFFAKMHIPDASPVQVSSYNNLLRLTTSPTNVVKLIKTFWELDVRDIVRQVRCPTLVLHARQDAIIPFDEGRLVASLIPGARFVPLESRNHLLLDTEPAWQALTEAIDNFLPAAQAEPGAGLTARENQVLELVAQGLDNGTIARRLGIAAKTVRNQVSIIFSKLGVNSRAQAIVRARDAGFGRKVSE
jgi:pimeloyl-ACP methyl ester carboxylesterase